MVKASLCQLYLVCYRPKMQKWICINKSNLADKKKNEISQVQTIYKEKNVEVNLGMVVFSLHCLKCF